MMKAISVFTLFIISHILLAQNLVPNNSFETYTMCPTTWAQVNYAIPWSNPLTNSADYFNACSSSSYSVPKAGSGYQYAKSGNAFVGLFSYNGIGFNYREYVQTQLATTLTVSNYYLIKFYCSSMGMLTYATNNISLNFSNASINNTGTGNVLNLTPHIYKFNNPIIQDSTNWVEIMGLYKSIGNEAFITIGNFKDDTNTDTLNLGNVNYKGAYYYIDDVSVEPICTPFWSYRDTTLAIGQDSVLIGPAITGLNINWYDATSTFITNAPGIYVKPAQTTTYTAVEDFCGTTYTNTIVVTVQPTGVKEMGDELGVMSLVPNPSNGLITITSQSDFTKVEVLGITGQTLLSESIHTKTHQLQLQNFAEGIYFVRITYADGLSTTKKVIVSR